MNMRPKTRIILAECGTLNYMLNYCISIYVY